jgi:hypothetical protein
MGSFDVQGYCCAIFNAYNPLLHLISPTVYYTRLKICVSSGYLKVVEAIC